MIKVIFGGRLPPSLAVNMEELLPDEKSSVASAHLHKNFGKIPS
jgi:hypothetical protein